MSEASHSFEAYYKRAASPLAVLRLLQERPMYGYEIAQAMKNRSGGRFVLSLLYPVLYRLEDQGYIEVARTEVIDNRVRSYYTVTAAGQAHYEKSLKEYYEIHQAFLDIIEGSEKS